MIISKISFIIHYTAFRTTNSIPILIKILITLDHEPGLHEVSLSKFYLSNICKCHFFGFEFGYAWSALVWCVGLAVTDD